MRLPQLSPLQSRLAASLLSSLLLLIIYFTISPPHFAYAAEVDSIRAEDHNHRLLEVPILDDELEDVFLETDKLEAVYTPDFMGVDRGIVGRQENTGDLIPLTNNVAFKTNVEQGRLLSYVFTNASLWGQLSPATPGLPKPPPEIKSTEVREREEDGEDGNLLERAVVEERQAGNRGNRTLYITVTTCLQPSPKSNVSTSVPPQLRFYVSTSKNNTTPGPSGNAAAQQVVTLDKGYGLLTLNATGDVFIGLYGDNTTDFKDVWNAHIAASIDAPFHVWLNNTDPNLFVTDSDSASALLVTDNLLSAPVNTTELYDQWMNLAPPYVIFASPLDDKNIQGLERSYCAWDSFAAMGASTPGKVSPNQIQSGMTSRGVDNLPKEQFYLGGLQPGAKYQAVLAMKGNSTSVADGTVGGGGQVFPAMTFDTLQNNNCGVIFNLSFCDSSAYAVPSNPKLFANMSSLAAFYDNYTQSYYENFKKVLAQTACETTSSAQYSLARTCTDCEIAYKRWLCSVTMPRCTDFDATHPWLIPRAMSQPLPNGTFLPTELTNSAQPYMLSSRNPIIDQSVIPGPYKEILPCEDLCYNVVQSCPASMGFQCPLQGDMGFEQAYGQRPEGAKPGVLEKSTTITCNYPGAAYFLAGSGRMDVSWWVMGGGLLVGILALM